MSGAVVFLMIVGAWILVTTAITAGLSLMQFVILPFIEFVGRVKEYKEKRLGERGSL